MERLRNLSLIVAAALCAHLYLSSSGTATAVGGGAGEPLGRIGVVDMERVFADFYKSKLASAEIDKMRRKIAEEVEDKKGTHTGLADALRELEKAMVDPTLSEATRRGHQAEAQARLAEIRALEREIQEYSERRSRQLFEQGQRSKAELLNEISEQVDETARAEGLRVVFDESGLSERGFPFVVFVDQGTDISDKVVQALNADAPKTALPTQIK